MKKTLFLFAFLLIAFITNACSDSCKTCSQVTYDASDNITNQGDDTEYCGVDLIVIEATPNVTIGENTTKWECN